jgi:hypothetical protein
MNKQPYRLCLFVYVSILMMGLCWYTLPSAFAGIPEPGIIYYGKVLDQNNNLLTSGVLTLSLTNASGETCITINTSLKEIKEGDETYSYSVLIPFETPVPGFPASKNTLPVTKESTTHYRTLSVLNTDIQLNDSIDISSENIGNATLLYVGNIPVVEFQSAIQSVNENQQTITIPISLDVASYEDIMVPFTISGSSNTMDYTLSDGIVIIEKGKTSTNLTFQLVNDLKIEADETIVISIGELTNAKLGNKTVHAVTIIDDDDTDHDGILDQWENRYFGNLETANATTDHDHDGYLDKMEYEREGTQDSQGISYNPLVSNAPCDEGFISSSILDIDGNGTTDGSTDGLLLIRHLFGYSGQNLIDNVVSDNCSRCTAETIEAYLKNKKAMLDVDNNGQIDPGTDAMLLIRYLFTYSDENLTKGVVASDCQRCTSIEIEQYLDKLSTGNVCQ